MEDRASSSAARRPMTHPSRRVAPIVTRQHDASRSTDFTVRIERRLVARYARRPRGDPNITSLEGRRCEAFYLSRCVLCP